MEQQIDRDRLSASWVLLSQEGDEQERQSSVDSRVTSSDMSSSIMSGDLSISLEHSIFDALSTGPNTPSSQAIGASLVEAGAGGGIEGDEVVSNREGTTAPVAAVRTVTSGQDDDDDPDINNAWWKRVVNILFKHIRSGMTSLGLNKPYVITPQTRLVLAVSGTVVAALLIGACVHSSSSSSSSSRSTSCCSSSSNRSTKLSSNAGSCHASPAQLHIRVL